MIYHGFPSIRACSTLNRALVFFRFSAVIIWTLSFVGCDDTQNRTSHSELTADASSYEDQADQSPPSEEGGGRRGVIPSTLEVRALRRISVEQLSRIIPVLTGGIRWEEDFGAGPVDMLTLLAPTLGAPDYRNVTQETLDPNVLMSKFINDGAQRICLKWVDRDRRSIPSDRTLVKPTSSNEAWDLVESGHINSNLARLLLRFFAITVDAEGQNPRLLALRELFDTARATSVQDPMGDAWFAVCLALMTDPEFSIY